MEQNVNNKIDIKNRFLNFYNNNKFKLYLFVCILMVLIISTLFIKINNQKENKLIAQTYIQAGLHLASGEKEKSKVLYEQIIFSKNKFYSVLALYSILEKDLEPDKNKILSYFKIIDGIKKHFDQTDLINFKKGLYQIKIGNSEEGHLLLKNLIDNNSKLKLLAEEIIIKKN